MSTTYSLACLDCRKTLWIGQSSGESPVRFYFPSMDGQLAVFLNAHRGHTLKFDHDEPFYDFEEVSLEKGKATFDSFCEKNLVTQAERETLVAHLITLRTLRTSGPVSGYCPHMVPRVYYCARCAPPTTDKLHA